MINILGQQTGQITMLPKAEYLLDNGSAVIVFRKKTNEIRVMLATRSYYICNLMEIEPHIGDPKNKNKFKEEGNITVMDLIARSTRVVNINRVLYSLWMTSATNKADIDLMLEAYNYCKEKWPRYDDMDVYQQQLFLKSFTYYGQAGQ